MANTWVRLSRYYKEIQPTAAEKAWVEATRGVLPLTRARPNFELTGSLREPATITIAPAGLPGPSGREVQRTGAERCLGTRLPCR